MVIEELAAHLGLEVDGATFAAGDKMIAAIRGGLVGVVAAAGAVGIAIAAAAAKTAAYADATAKAAERTGIAVDTLQALQYAAERADVSAGDLEGALRFAAKRGVKELEGELRRAAAQFERMPDGAAKAALAMQLFGKQGTALIPMLNKGTAGLDEMMRTARDMGIVLSAETQADAEALKETIEKVQGYLRGFAYTVAGPFLKPIREALERFMKWFRESRPQIQKWAESVGRFFGGALKTVMQLLEPVVDLLMRFQTWVTSSVPGMIAAFTALAFKIGLPWTLGLVALTAFLMALEEVWGWMTGKRKHTLLGEWLGPFDEFKKKFDEAFNPEDSFAVKLIVAIGKAAQIAAEAMEKMAALLEFFRTGTTSAGRQMTEYGENLREAYRRTGLAEVPGAQDAIRSDPRFNELVAAGDWPAIDKEYGRHSVFRRRMESMEAGYTPDYALPTVPTPLLQGGDMNLTLNVTAPPGVDAKTWASQLAGELRGQLRGMIQEHDDAVNSAALPAAAR